MLVPDDFEIWIPGGIGFSHGVQDDEHFSHAGDHSDFVRLASCGKPFVERANDWITALSGHGRHV